MGGSAAVADLRSGGGAARVPADAPALRPDAVGSARLDARIGRLPGATQRWDSAGWKKFTSEQSRRVC